MDKNQKPVGRQANNREFFSNEIMSRLQNWKFKENAEADAIMSLHTCVLEVNEKTGMVATQTQAVFNGSEKSIYFGMVEVADNIPLFKSALLRAAKYFTDNEEGDDIADVFLGELKKAGIEADKIGTVIIQSEEHNCKCPFCIAKRATDKSNPNVN